MKLEKYTTHMPSRVLAGPGAMEGLGEIFAGHTRALLLTGGSVYRHGLAERPEALLKAAGIEYRRISNVPAEPTVDQVDEIIASVQEFRPDLVIGMGGGSVMDTAKLVSACPRPGTSARRLLDDFSLVEKGAETVMIPTTAGSGSEATPNAIVTVPEQELKVGIVNTKLIADNVVLDPAATATLPRHIAASAGVDALAHTIECYTSNKANAFSDIWAMKGMRLIFSSIEAACNGGDEEARANMLLGAFYGGVAIAASGTTAVHALSYPLGGKYHVPHGVSNAMLLYPVMEFNKDAIEPRLAEVYDGVFGQNGAFGEARKADAVIGEIRRIVRSLDIPEKLSAYVSNIDEELDTLVDSAFEVKRLLNNNIKALTKDDIRNIYLTLM